MPTIQRIHFTNAQGTSLAAALVLPSTGQPRAFALFAHCFTCGKDSAAATRISRTLAGTGIAVVRFDFTGIGDSEGEFGNSNFSANVEDLLAAADYLRREHSAPALLIGHSLGGTAVLAAAPHIPECTAIVTIAAPASPAHLLRYFNQQPDGTALASIGGQEFAVAQPFVDDLTNHSIVERVRDLKRALLVFHAPFDAVVSIDEAGTLFQAAKHPKSFVSLHGADHLLSKLADAQYVAQTLSAWAQRYLPPAEADARPAVTGGAVSVAEANHKFLRDVHSDDHSWLADEPSAVGGENLGPDPYEHLLAALGTCTSMTIRMYANRKQWPLDDIDITLAHRREHVADCTDCTAEGDGNTGGAGARLDIIDRQITLHGAELSAQQRTRLLEIADRCPVHRTLVGELRITTQEVAPLSD